MQAAYIHIFFTCSVHTVWLFTVRARGLSIISARTRRGDVCVQHGVSLRICHTASTSAVDFTLEQLGGGGGAYMRSG